MGPYLPAGQLEVTGNRRAVAGDGPRHIVRKIEALQMREGEVDSCGYCRVDDRERRVERQVGKIESARRSPRRRCRYRLDGRTGRACGSAASHRMSAARIIRPGGHCEAFDGSLAALLASLFGPTHKSARCGAACTSFTSASSRSPKLDRASCSRVAPACSTSRSPMPGCAPRARADLHVGWGD